MKRISILAVGALALAGCQDTSAPLAPESTPSLDRASAQLGDRYVEGRVLVAFRAGADVNGIARGQGARIEGDLLDGRVRMLKVPAGAVGRVVEALSRNPNVVFAEPDWIRTFGNPCETTGCSTPTDTYFGYKWDLHNDGTITTSGGVDEMATGKVDADVDWLEAYDQLSASGFNGSAVVGIIDTGVHAAHPDLSGKVIGGYDFVDNDPDANDEDGHGTHVAGIVAAHGNDGRGVTGIAYNSNVKLLAARVCGPNGCPSSAIVNGIQWAADNGANVLNLSLGGRFGSATEQQALQYALSKNVLPFCATGNDGQRRVSYPAAFPECVAVGATNWSDGKASYSNSGSETELSAPGGDSEDANGRSYILSTFYDHTDGYVGYVFMAGTSMATPQAAGLAGLLYANGVTSATDLRNRMAATADDLGSAGRDASFGHGRINVYRALNNLTSGDGGGDGGDGGGGCKGGPKKCG